MTSVSAYFLPVFLVLFAQIAVEALRMYQGKVPFFPFLPWGYSSCSPRIQCVSFNCAGSCSTRDNNNPQTIWHFDQSPNSGTFPRGDTTRGF